MRILLVGAQGTIGRGVAAELGARHDIVDAGRSRGSVNLDLADTASLHRAFAARPGGRDRIGGRPRRLGPAARDHAGAMGLQRGEQADGQVNLALVGARYLRDGGSITLTSGVLLDQPVRSGAAASLANGGVEAFVRAAAIELPRGLRIKCHQPRRRRGVDGRLREYVFRGFEPVPVARVALAYSRSVEAVTPARSTQCSDRPPACESVNTPMHTHCVQMNWRGRPFGV